MARLFFSLSREVSRADFNRKAGVGCASLFDEEDEDEDVDEVREEETARANFFFLPGSIELALWLDLCLPPEAVRFEDLLLPLEQLFPLTGRVTDATESLITWQQSVGTQVWPVAWIPLFSWVTGHFVS